MFRIILGILLFIVLIMLVGTTILDEFPQLQPLFDELVMHTVTLYNLSIVKYGTVTTILFIIALIVLIGTSSSKKWL